MHLRRAPAIPRRDFARVVASITLKHRGRRESRVLAAPAASCAKVKKRTSIVTTGSAKTHRLSPREWLYGLLRDLPGGAGLLSPSPCGNIPQDLTPASRRQNHTTWPYALAFSSGEKSPDAKTSIASRTQRS